LPLSLSVPCFHVAISTDRPYCEFATYPSGPGWNPRKDAGPGEIIEVALDLFVLNGFAATKLTEVAERAGVVKGTIYRYFDTSDSEWLDLEALTMHHADMIVRELSSVR